LLGLLKLYDATADATVLERARACAKRILSRQIESGEARGGWALPGQPPLSGFSHGAAGIAYALVKLHAITDESDLLHAARAAVAFERTLFVPSAANWSRTNAPPDRLPASLRATWCQGAPGIVLSRLGMLDALGSAVVGEDLDAALETTACHPVNTIDHLCCGNLGRADALVVAGSRLDRPVLRHIALHRAGQVAARARRTGTWALPEDGGPYRHGFFQGRAGIGYTLLRFAYPGALPAVLMWQ
jgi:lantibiotic modifying enzyme